MLAPTEGGEGLNFAKQKIGERLTTPQSRCSRASSPDKGSQGCGGGGEREIRKYPIDKG